MKTSVQLLISLALFFLLALVTAACAPDAGTPGVAPDYPTMVQVAGRETATSDVTEAPVIIPTPADIQAVADAVTRALDTGDATQFSPLLLDNLWLGPDNAPEQGETVKRDDGVKWLGAHWGKASFVSDNYVRDSAMLEIATSGWQKVAPLEQGLVLFHLHRYNAGGQEDDLAGQWRIDTILYQ